MNNTSIKVLNFLLKNKKNLIVFKKFLFKKRNYFENSDKFFYIKPILRLIKIKNNIKPDIGKLLFFNEKTSYEICFYIKKIILLVLEYYTFTSETFLFSVEKNTDLKLLEDFHNILNNSKILFLKKLYNRLILKKVLSTKSDLFLQKKFLNYIFKYKSLYKIIDENNYIKKLFTALVKNNNKINFEKNKFSEIKCLYHKKKNINKITNYFVLFKRLLGLIMKKGNKTKALKTIKKSLLLTSSNLKLSVNSILLGIFKKLKSSVELKKIRNKRNYHMVPFPVNFKRKFFLIGKLLLDNAKKQEKKDFFSNKLSLEIQAILTTEESLSYLNKKFNIAKAKKNTSNSHFRW